MAIDDPAIVAVAAGYAVDNIAVPVLDINDIPALARFILKHTGLAS